MGKNRYSVVAYYTRDLVYERLGPGLLKELESKSPKNGDGHRPSRFHQWLTEDVGDPLLAQHLHSLVMLQRLALANRARLAPLSELGQSRTAEACQDARRASWNGGTPRGVFYALCNSLTRLHAPSMIHSLRTGALWLETTVRRKGAGARSTLRGGGPCSDRGRR